MYTSHDYHRSISEILKLKFQYPESSDTDVLDLFLLKSYYRLKDYRSMDALVPRTRSFDDSPLRPQFGLLLTASWLERGEGETARETWYRIGDEEDTGTFPTSETVDGMVDPDRAAFLSGIVPGSGFLLTGQYGNAAVSFLLNAVFIWGAYTAVTEQQLGTAGLLTFFEINWYIGGKKASAEAAENHNRRLLQDRQQAWLKMKFNRYQMSEFH